MISSIKCQVCNEVVSKYRCPKCLLVYCSLCCFTIHKDKLCSVQATLIAESKEISRKVIQSSPVEKEDGEVSDDELQETEDRVPKEILEKLGDSEAVRDLLENPHLRHMLTGVVESDNPVTAMETAMKEPIFVEFADRCLCLADRDRAKKT